MKNSLILLSFALVLLSTPAFAKDMSKRLGVGYSNQTSLNLPSIKAKYYSSEDLAFSAALGINSGDDEDQFALLAKVYKTIYPEDNLNFYMGGGAGLISEKTDADNESGFELMAFIGAEFFLPGLDSLAFSFEAGVGVTSIDSGVTFRTIGDHPLRAGLLFYF